MSVQGQAYPHREMLIVYDSGTTDSTPKLVQERAQRDSRIRLIQVPKGGAWPFHEIMPSAKLRGAIWHFWTVMTFG